MAKEKEPGETPAPETEENEDFKEFKLRKLDSESLSTSFKEQAL